MYNRFNHIIIGGKILIGEDSFIKEVESLLRDIDPDDYELVLSELSDLVYKLKKNTKR